MFLDGRAASHSLEKSPSPRRIVLGNTIKRCLLLYASIPPHRTKADFFSEKGVTYIVRCRCQMVICEATAE